MKYPKTEKRREGYEPRIQYAALPWRAGSAVEVMLASSRETRRWIIPKGWPMKGRKPHATAAIEALQEAGLLGKIDKTPIGSYHYQKRMPNGAIIPCRVDVFPFRVTRQRKTWPEMRQRITKWFPREEAAQLVHEPELSRLILSFDRIAPKTPKKPSSDGA